MQLIQINGMDIQKKKFYASLESHNQSVLQEIHIVHGSNLYNINNKFIGVEVGAPAISSPSYGDSLGDSTGLSKRHT